MKKEEFCYLNKLKIGEIIKSKFPPLFFSKKKIIKFTSGMSLLLKPISKDK